MVPFNWEKVGQKPLLYYFHLNWVEELFLLLTFEYTSFNNTCINNIKGSRPIYVTSKFLRK